MAPRSPWGRRLHRKSHSGISAIRTRSGPGRSELLPKRPVDWGRPVSPRMQPRLGRPDPHSCRLPLCLRLQFGGNDLAAKARAVGVDVAAVAFHSTRILPADRNRPRPLLHAPSQYSRPDFSSTTPHSPPRRIHAQRLVRSWWDKPPACPSERSSDTESTQSAGLHTATFGSRRFTSTSVPSPDRRPAISEARRPNRHPNFNKINPSPPIT
jgi:hypothetical protein